MSLSGIVPLEQSEGLKTRAYEALRELIGHMDIYSSKDPIRLDERALGEQLGVSRTPVREAISRLEQEGIVLRGSDDAAEEPVFKWSQISENTYALSLAQTCRDLKAFSVDFGHAVEIAPEALLEQWSNSQLVLDAAARGIIMIAGIGNQILQGNGEIMRVVTDTEPSAFNPGISWLNRDGELSEISFASIGGIIPQVSAVLGSHPNPFNPSTEIKLALHSDQQVRLDIFDVSGRKVKTLHDGKLHAGNHSITWHGRNDSGRSVSSGIYFAVITTDEFSEHLKLSLLK